MLSPGGQVVLRLLQPSSTGNYALLLSFGMPSLIVTSTNQLRASIGKTIKKKKQLNRGLESGESEVLDNCELAYRTFFLTVVRVFKIGIRDSRLS